MKENATLIVTTNKDIHAIAVEMAMALKSREEVVRWVLPAPPESQNHSLSINNEDLEWKCHFSSGLNFKTVWLRRLAFPKINDERLADDKFIIERELKIFLTSMYADIGPNAFWINPASSVPQANNKIHQLILAKNIGLLIPKTLFSNNPLEVRPFVQSCRSCIYKSFTSIEWENNVLYAAKITEKQLPNDLYLQNMPGIYQEEIRKKHELRIVMFGHYPIAVKISLKSNETNYIDWRKFQDEDLLYQKIELPDKVVKKLQAMMDMLGIVFGCIDMLVTEEGEYVFLEINEQGQFLWIEANNPEIKLLDPFLDFILNRKVSFSWQESTSAISLVRDVFETDEFKKTYQSEPHEKRNH